MVRIRTALKFSLLVFVQGLTLGRLDEISIEWYEHMRASFLFSATWPGSRATGFSGRKLPRRWSCTNLETSEYFTFLPFRCTVNNKNKIGRAMGNKTFYGDGPATTANGLK